MENNTATLCIPRMDMGIPKSYIFKAMCKLQIGFIETIIEIPFVPYFDPNEKKSRPTAEYKRVIIRVKWNETESAQYVRKRFADGKNIKIVHSMPWFWICMPNRPTSYPKPYQLLDYTREDT